MDRSNAKIEGLSPAPPTSSKYVPSGNSFLARYQNPSNVKQSASVAELPTSTQKRNLAHIGTGILHTNKNTTRAFP